MTDSVVPRLPKWPFLVGDALLLLIAGGIVYTAPHPLPTDRAALVVLCGAIAAWTGIYPFLREYHTRARLSEGDKFQESLVRFTKIEELTSQVTSVSGQWSHIQDDAKKSLGAAREIAERMQHEADAFKDFLQKAQDTEKNHLRLEVDKLRRSESEWLQMLVLLMDHIFALHQAGVRSGQTKLVEQLAHFQNACRDVVRRVGLTAVSPQPGDPYNENTHLTSEDTETPAPGARIGEVVATGYTFQGQLVRKALVRCAASNPPATHPNGDSVPENPIESESATAPESATAKQSSLF